MFALHRKAPRVLFLTIAVTVTGAAFPAAATQSNSSTPSSPKKHKSDKDNDALIRPDQVHNPVIWHDPGTISALDMLDGHGGADGHPVPPFRFEDEDLHESTPKFDARDANDTKWRVKLGHETRPEVVASRLLWATGYFVNDDYVLPHADVAGLHMKRGKQYIHGTHIEDARFARKPDGEKKIYTWRWRHNPFTGTRELNGLRVMMAVLNSWDLKDENNAVFSDKKKDRQIFLVSDIGTTFGRTGLHFVNNGSKDNAKNYEDSKFITKTTDTTVDFATPTPSYSLEAETLGGGTKQFVEREKMLWIGRDIPRADARWIGSMLGQLTHQQLVDAFRAGNYPPGDVEEFVKTLEDRIKALQAL